MNLYVDEFIKKALEEDLGILGDITTDNLFSDNDCSKGEFNFREDAVLAGINFAKRVFEIMDNEIDFDIKIKDGESVKKGTTVAIIKGRTKTILKGERIALNIMQRLSGIATNAKKYSDKIESYNTKVVDTRKTTPLFRYFEKYAVKAGGASNHRFGLYDAVMLKDNHIKAAGSIKQAVEKIREKVAHTTKIEVETDRKEQVLEALEVGADIIMLDNMRGSLLKECVDLINGKAISEASGMINLENIEEVAKSGVDIISTGAVIYNAQNIDIGLDFL